MKRLLLLFLLIPTFLYAGINTWTFDSCSGLTKENLSLSIDGKKIPIQSLTEDSFRYIIFVIDTQSSEVNESTQLAATIMEKIDKRDVISIATISGRGLHYVSMFNADRSAALDSLKSIQVESPQKEDPRFGILDGLVQLAMQMSILGGPKHIVLFSPGFKTDGLRDYQDSDPEAPELVMGEVSEEERLRWQKSRADRKESGPRVEVSKIPELFSGSGAKVSIALGIDNSFYKSLADTTDGTLITNSEDLDFGSRCIAGWQTESEMEFKRLHKLKIETGSQVLLESPWIAPRSLQSLTLEERKLKAAEAIYKDSNHDESFRFLVDSIFHQGENGIPMFAQISGKHLTKAQEASLEFYGFAISAEGRIVDSFMTPLKLDLKNKKLKERIDRSGVKLWNILYPDAASFKVQWVILDLISDQIFTHVAQVEPQPESLSLSIPFFPDTNLDWVLWPAPSTVSNRNGKEIRYPYSTGSDYFSPNLNPSIALHEGGVLYMRMYNKDPHSKNPPIAFHLIDESGKTASIEQFQLLQKPITLEKNGLELFWRIMSFPETGSGPARLQVEIRDTQSGQIIKRHTSLRIL